MAHGMIGSGGNGNMWRVARWTAAALLLLTPLVLNAPWDLSDYVFAAVMIIGVGLLFELALWMIKDTMYRAALACAIAGMFCTVWVSAAVGMVGESENPLNLMFAGVLALIVLGAFLVRFRAQGMAAVLVLAAASQVIAGAIGAFTDLIGGIASAGFAIFWLASAGLFAKSAHDRRDEAQQQSG
jgi:hypothetical protein